MVQTLLLPRSLSPSFFFCPQANLLSSHRSLVYRVETIALGDQPCDRGENVTLFLFNDCLEVSAGRLGVGAETTLKPFFFFAPCLGRSHESGTR